MDVVSGYSGGAEVNPRYEDVKLQKTGHRETIRIDYDPQKVSYSELLDIFLNGVDPFDDGGQFIDRGHSYTLAVYYGDDREREAAERAIAAGYKTVVFDRGGYVYTGRVAEVANGAREAGLEF